MTTLDASASTELSVDVASAFALADPPPNVALSTPELPVLFGVDVLFAIAQNLSAAICSGRHSRQYLPFAQQSAICWLGRERA